MTGQTNTGGGGIGAQRKGTIVVTYPSSATCTVTNGSQTYTALDTSGAAAFIVEPGTWTVKAVQGSDTDSKSVTVTAGGWVEVELSFYTYLIKNGVDNTTVTGGFINAAFGYSDAIPTVVGTEGEAFMLGVANYSGQTVYRIGAVAKNKISLAGLNTISFTFDAALKGKTFVQEGNTIRLVVCNNYSTDAPIASSVLVTGGNEVSGATGSLDVSTLNGEYYIGIFGSIFMDVPGNAYVKFYDLKIMK